MEKIVKLLQAATMTQKHGSEAPLYGTKDTPEAKWENDDKYYLACQRDMALDHGSSVDSAFTESPPEFSLCIRHKKDRRKRNMRFLPDVPVVWDKWWKTLALWYHDKSA